MAAQTRLTHQSSADRKATQQPVEALLHASDILEALGWQAFGISVGARNPINKWRTWGTLLNRKVEVKPSKVPGAGRGLYAGRETSLKKDQVITMYSGALLSRREMKEIDEGEHNYMLRMSGTGQGNARTVMYVDGKEYADKLTHTEDVDGEQCYLPMPGDTSGLGQQGAGSLCNDAKGEARANARLDFKYLDKQNILPPIPVIVAKRDIAPGEEILFNYGTDKPHLYDDPNADATGPGDTTALKRKRPDGNDVAAEAAEAAVAAAETVVVDSEADTSSAARAAAAPASSFSLAASASEQPADDDEEEDGEEPVTRRSMTYRSLCACAPVQDAKVAGQAAKGALLDEELLAKMKELGLLGW